MPKPKKAKRPVKTKKAIQKPAKESKNQRVLALLERKQGATVKELMELTGWQSHSVRGHISNLRRKGKADIEAFTTGDGERSYRIPAAQASSSAA